MLNPTPPDRLVDRLGRPTFLWDTDLTLEALRERLGSPDVDVRAYWAGTVLREARPDDALTLVPLDRIREDWSHLQPYLGRSRAFWIWYLDELAKRGR